MKICTGQHCIMQYDKIDPEKCQLTKEECIYRTEIDTDSEYWRGFVDGCHTVINILRESQN